MEATDCQPVTIVLALGSAAPQAFADREGFAPHTAAAYAACAVAECAAACAAAACAAADCDVAV